MAASAAAASAQGRDNAAAAAALAAEREALAAGRALLGELAGREARLRAEADAAAAQKEVRCGLMMR